MRNGILCLMLLSGTLFASSAAFADTAIIYRADDTGVVVPVPPPPDTDHNVVIEHHHSSGDCDSKTVHKENDQGDSKTVKKTHCD